MKPWFNPQHTKTKRHKLPYKHLKRCWKHTWQNSIHSWFLKKWMWNGRKNYQSTKGHLQTNKQTNKSVLNGGQIYIQWLTYLLVNNWMSPFSTTRQKSMVSTLQHCSEISSKYNKKNIKKSRLEWSRKASFIHRQHDFYVENSIESTKKLVELVRELYQACKFCSI